MVVPFHSSLSTEMVHLFMEATSSTKESPIPKEFSSRDELS